MRIPGFAGMAPMAVLRHALKGFFDDDMGTYAAALAFHILLALFPFLIFFLTVLGALGLSDFFAWLLGQARIALPPDAYDLVARVIGEIEGQSRAGLLSFSIVFALLAASSGVRSLMDALNVAYSVAETRPPWRRFPLSIVYTIGLAALLTVTTALMLAGPRAVQWIAEQMRLSQAAATIWTWLRWPLVILLLLLAFALIDRVMPNIDKPFRFVTPGSVLGVAAWIVASVAFSFYIERFANVGATYGSLGGMIVLLLYFYFSSAVLLFAAEINAAIHSAAAREAICPFD